MICAFDNDRSAFPALSKRSKESPDDDALSSAPLLEERCDGRNGLDRRKHDHVDIKISDGSAITEPEEERTFEEDLLDKNRVEDESAQVGVEDKMRDKNVENKEEREEEESGLIGPERAVEVAMDAPESGVEVAMETVAMETERAISSKEKRDSPTVEGGECGAREAKQRKFESMSAASYSAAEESKKIEDPGESKETPVVSSNPTVLDSNATSSSTSSSPLSTPTHKRTIGRDANEQTQQQPQHEQPEHEQPVKQQRHSVFSPSDGAVFFSKSTDAEEEDSVKMTLAKREEEVSLPNIDSASEVFSDERTEKLPLKNVDLASQDSSQSLPEPVNMVEPSIYRVSYRAETRKWVVKSASKLELLEFSLCLALSANCT